VKACFILLICFAFLGCGRDPAQPSEAQLQANGVLNATFRGNTEFWFGVEEFGGRHYLREFHNPKSTLLAKAVTDTDRMNGISQRFVLSVTFEQYRTWDGAWSEWKAGTAGGSKDLINAMVGGLFGYWVISFEKKNDQWDQRIVNGRHFLSDRQLLATLMANAGVSE
jgi:hypothetical protein